MPEAHWFVVCCSYPSSWLCFLSVTLQGWLWFCFLAVMLQGVVLCCRQEEVGLIWHLAYHMRVHLPSYQAQFLYHLELALRSQIAKPASWNRRSSFLSSRGWDESRTDILQTAASSSRGVPSDTTKFFYSLALPFYFLIVATFISYLKRRGKKTETLKLMMLKFESYREE